MCKVMFGVIVVHLYAVIIIDAVINLFTAYYCCVLFMVYFVLILPIVPFFLLSIVADTWNRARIFFVYLALWPYYRPCGK